MNLIAYLLKANLGLVLFLAGYVFFYRQGTLFRLNRFYFLIGSLAVLLLPLVDLKTFFEKPKLSQLAVIDLVPSVGYVHDQHLVEQDFGQSLSSTEVILLVGLLGMCVMFLRFLLQCLSLYWLKSKATEVPFLSNNWAKIVRARLYFLTNPISPFSFFNWIFVSPSLHTPQELDDIITHEQVHVGQWHSIDVLVAEVLVVVLWYNPLVWLWQSFLKQNLEFLTDQTLIINGIDSKQYQYNLLKISVLNSQFEIVNHFNYKQLKTRIAMMNKQRSSKMNALKIVFALPMVAILLTAFNKSTNLALINTDLKTTLTNATTNANTQAQWVLRGTVTDHDNQALANAQVLVFKHNTSIENMNSVDAKNYAIASTKTDGQGGYEITLSEPLVRVAYLQEGMPLQWLDVRKNWTADVKITKDGSSEVKVLESEPVRKDNSDPKEEAKGNILVTPKGDTLATKKKAFINKQTDEMWIIDSSTVKIKIKNKDANKEKKPIYVLDGVIITDQNKNMIDQLMPNNIDKIEVFKDEKAYALYGEKGKDGVILIHTKKNSTKATEERKMPVEKEIEAPVEMELKVKKGNNKVVIKKINKAVVEVPIPVEVAPKRKN